MPFSLLMWLALQIFWRTFSAFHCTSHNSSFLMCLSVRPNLYVSLCCFIGSLCQLIFVSSLCILYVLTGCIVFADGKVQPYSPSCLEAYATLEGWLCVSYILSLRNQKHHALFHTITVFCVTWNHQFLHCSVMPAYGASCIVQSSKLILEVHDNWLLALHWMSAPFCIS